MFSLGAYRWNHGSWLQFSLLFLTPDISMLGYLANERVGAWVYNAIHTYAGPLILAGSALWTNHHALLLWALIWFAHIGFDRMLGFGLKYPTGFKHTHLSQERHIIAGFFIVVACGTSSGCTSSRNSASVIANSAIALDASARQRLTEDPDLELPTLLAVESMRRLPLFENDRDLRLALSLRLRHRWVAETGGKIRSVAYSPTGSFVASAGEDNAVRVFEAASGKEAWRIVEPSWVLAVKFSADDRWLAAGGSDGTARVFEAVTGKEISRLTEERSCSGPVVQSRWTAGSRRGSADHTARVFETASGKQISRLAEGYEVEAVAFSPDGCFVAAAGSDHTVRVFEARSCKTDVAD